MEKKVSEKQTCNSKSALFFVLLLVIYVQHTCFTCLYKSQSELCIVRIVDSSLLLVSLIVFYCIFSPFNCFRVEFEFIFLSFSLSFSHSHILCMCDGIFWCVSCLCVHIYIYNCSLIVCCTVFMPFSFNTQ